MNGLESWEEVPEIPYLHREFGFESRPRVGSPQLVLTRYLKMLESGIDPGTSWFEVGIKVRTVNIVYYNPGHKFVSGVKSEKGAFR